MNIIGLDSLVFGVDDYDASVRCLQDYGLKQAHRGMEGGLYEALDGTSIEVRRAGDAGLPSAISRSPNIRETIYGVADQATLDAIGAELSKDRPALLDAEGVLHSRDDSGIAIGFRVTVRRPIVAPPVLINVPGMPPQRPPNVVAADPGAMSEPRSLSHVVYFVPDVAKAERFYVERLGFRMIDRFSNVGPFLRPAGTQEHHTLFLIQAPEHMLGINHFTFHMAGASELLQAGWKFREKGWKGFWGPGRHIFGSNYFWYFNSPFGGAIEYDADMDLHDDSWVPREVDAAEDTSQIFLFEHRPLWFPRGGDPH
ncbi:VOC family protein [Pseudoxanthomonas sp.]|uniref:VOC family protein n=1 Tax=Pseudoxanthomonas sp. TaxID=1871049 RepID=UPI0026357C25|nr:VOC family protein [Pseudoxanthomonas sp.]WDS35031.1 MAG: VOC family protein [Pseudoxanthomonas sp.]